MSSVMSPFLLPEQKLCACGRVATAFCTRCYKPLCGRHMLCDVNWFFENYRNNRMDLDRVVCEECNSKADAAQESLRQEAAQGQACGKCFSRHIQGKCSICGVGVCSEHRVVCETCGQLVCERHVSKNGRIVIVPGSWWQHASYYHDSARQCAKCEESDYQHLSERLTQASPWYKLGKKLGLQK